MTIDLAPLASAFSVAWPPVVVLLTAVVTNHYNAKSNRESRSHDATLETTRAERASADAVAASEREVQREREAASVKAAEEAVTLLRLMHEEFLAGENAHSTEARSQWQDLWPSRTFHLRLLALRAPDEDYRRDAVEAFAVSTVPWIAPSTLGFHHDELAYLDLFSELFAAQLRGGPLGPEAKSKLALFSDDKRRRTPPPTAG